MPRARTVFVTVGTTKFDALISACDSPQLADMLVKKGYTRLVMQVGSAGYLPHRLFPPNSRTAQLHSGLSVEWFDFAPSLAPHLEAADLVVSHAGSGSIFESLRLGRPLVVVPNPLLMDNHQAELAEKLESLGHLRAATPATLADVIGGMRQGELVPYQKGDPGGIAAAIDAFMGQE